MRELSYTFNDLRNAPLGEAVVLQELTPSPSFAPAEDELIAGLSQRPELAAQRAALAAQSELSELAWGDLLPQLYFLAEGGYKDGDLGYTEGDPYWMATIALRWNLMADATAWEKLDTAEIAEEKAALEYDTMERKMALDLAQALRQYRELEAILSVAEEAVHTAQEGVDNARLAYEEDVLPIDTLAQAHKELAGAKDQFVQAHYGRLLTEVQLRYHAKLPLYDATNLGAKPPLERFAAPPTHHRRHPRRRYARCIQTRRHKGGAAMKAICTTCALIAALCFPLWAAAQPKVLIHHSDDLSQAAHRSFARSLAQRLPIELLGDDAVITTQALAPIDAHTPSPQPDWTFSLDTQAQDEVQHLCATLQDHAASTQHCIEASEDPQADARQLAQSMPLPQSHQPAQDQDEKLIPWHQLNYTWLAAGLTIASFTAAVIVSAEASSLEDDLQAMIDQGQEEPVPGASISPLQERVDDQALLANVFWGLTLAGAITTGVIYYYETEQEQEDATEALLLTPSLGPNQAGLQVIRRF